VSRPRVGEDLRELIGRANLPGDDRPARVGVDQRAEHLAPKPAAPALNRRGQVVVHPAHQAAEAGIDVRLAGAQYACV